MDTRSFDDLSATRTQTIRGNPRPELMTVSSAVSRLDKATLLRLTLSEATRTTLHVVDINYWRPHSPTQPAVCLRLVGRHL